MLLILVLEMEEVKRRIAQNKAVLEVVEKEIDELKPKYKLLKFQGKKEMEKLEMLGSIVSRLAHYDACVNLSTLCKSGIFWQGTC